MLKLISIINVENFQKKRRDFWNTEQFRMSFGLAELPITFHAKFRFWAEK